MTGLAEAVGLQQQSLIELIAQLAATGHTVAIAESLTAGLALAVLTEVPGASAVIRGGLVVYATDLKHTLARVDSELLECVGPVDPEVAIALATGARTRCGATIGLGLTGVAGPEPQDGVPVGTVFVAMTAVDGSETVVALDQPGNRPQIRAAAVREAVSLLFAAARLSGRVSANSDDRFGREH